jgi:hypothetical protein
MRTNKPGFGTLFVFLLSLLFAAAPSAASARLAGRDAAVSATAGTMKARAEARPLSEVEWVENDTLGGGGDVPDPALAASSSYPAEVRLPSAGVKAPAGRVTHGAHRQAPPATGPPAA